MVCYFAIISEMYLDVRSHRYTIAIGPILSEYAMFQDDDVCVQCQLHCWLFLRLAFRLISISSHYPFWRALSPTFRLDM